MLNSVSFIGIHIAPASYLFCRVKPACLDITVQVIMATCNNPTSPCFGRSIQCSDNNNVPRDPQNQVHI